MSEPRNPTDLASRPGSDPLLDAYQQANRLDDAQPSPQVRRAVLAHARVVAQAAGTNAIGSTRAMPEAIVTRPAANDRAWYWRAAAGLVLGIAGFWVYRAAVPVDGDTQVAAAPTAAPTSATTAERANADATTANAAADGKLAEASAAAATRTTTTPGATSSESTTVVASAAPERAQVPSVPAARRDAPRAAEAMASANQARSNGNAALAKTRQDESLIASAPAAAAPAITVQGGPAPPAPAAPPAPPPAAVAAATQPPAAPSIAAARAPQAFPASPAATAATAPPEEMVAIAESAKRATISGRAAPDAAVATAGAPARSERSESRAKIAPEQVASAAPAPAAPATPPAPAASAAAPPRIGDMTPGMQRGMANAALLAALRSGNVEGVRNALLRGADVNVRDDRGRAALQIARESNQTEIIRLLEAAGAR